MKLKKIIICPYHQNNNKCTHKYADKKKKEKHRICDYLDPNNCTLFQEWLEIHLACNNVSYNTNLDSLEECTKIEEKSILYPFKPKLKVSDS